MSKSTFSLLLLLPDLAEEATDDRDEAEFVLSLEVSRVHRSSFILSGLIVVLGCGSGIAKCHHHREIQLCRSNLSAQTDETSTCGASSGQLSQDTCSANL
jgi:hypothetical protein